MTTTEKTILLNKCKELMETKNNRYKFDIFTHYYNVSLSLDTPTTWDNDYNHNTFIGTIILTHGDKRIQLGVFSELDCRNNRNFELYTNSGIMLYYSPYDKKWN